MDQAHRRARPSDRNGGKGVFVFADGHARDMEPDELDDYDGDGVPDNGYWNGYGHSAPNP